MIAALVAVLSLAACHHGPQNEAVRQGVIDRLTQAGLNLDAMNVNVTAIEGKGSEVAATVAITLKTVPDAPPTVMKYRMQEQGGKWVVVGREDVGSGAHAAGPVPAEKGSPHGGDAGGKMPSPEDLPPAGKKK